MTSYTQALIKQITITSWFPALLLAELNLQSPSEKAHISNYQNLIIGYHDDTQQLHINSNPSNIHFFFVLA